MVPLVQRGEAGIVAQSRVGWFRYKIAKLMDRLDDTCWAELVLWAVNPELHPFWEILEMRHTAGQCEKRGEPPYCGKCAVRRKEK